MDKGSKAWMIVAIIFIVLFVIETAFIVWASSIAYIDSKRTDECYYDVCKDYPQALVEGRVCTCYDYNSDGTSYVVAKTELIG